MDGDLEREISTSTILRKYHEEIDKIKARPNGRGFFNGCQERAPRLLADLQNVGINGIIIVVNSSQHLTHESDAVFRWHHVVMDDKYIVYGPNYTGRVPIPLTNYIQTAYFLPKYFLPADIRFWVRGDTSSPFARFTDELHLDYSPFR